MDKRYALRSTPNNENSAKHRGQSLHCQSRLSCCQQERKKCFDTTVARRRSRNYLGSKTTQSFSGEPARDKGEGDRGDTGGAKRPVGEANVHLEQHGERVSGH